MRRGITAFMLAVAFGLSQAASAQDIRSEHVRFEAGQSGTSIADKVIGYEDLSYVVGAEAGQNMTISHDPSNLATHFNVYAPGRGPGDEALAVSEMDSPTVPDMNRFSGGFADGLQGGPAT